MGAKILVADDDLLISQLLESKLRSRGYEVLHAADGEEAIQLAQSERPAIILLDVMMPGLDGVEVLRFLQQHPEVSSIPVIMLSARKAENDVVTGLRLGATDYMVKPFMPEELFARIERALAKSARAA